MTSMLQTNLHPYPRRIRAFFPDQHGGPGPKGARLRVGAQIGGVLLAALLAACGGGAGGGVAPAVVGIKSLSAPVGTYAQSYTVWNLAPNGWINSSGGRSPINATGQVVYAGYDGEYFVSFFDGNASAEVRRNPWNYVDGLSVNKNGRIVGNECCYKDGNWYGWQPFSWAAGQMKVAPTGGWLASINDPGTAVGYTEGGRAFMWSPQSGEWKQFPDSGMGSYAYAINEAGIAAGYRYAPSTGVADAFRWSTPSDAATALTGTTWMSTYGYAINGTGTVVGQGYSASGEVGAFTWNPDAADATILGYPADAGSAEGFYTRYAYAHKVADTGQVAGRANYTDSNGNWRGVGVVWHGPALATVSTLSLGGQHSHVDAMNRAGLAGGYATTSNGSQVGVVWSESQGTRNVNDLLPPDAGLHIWAVTGVSDNGTLVAESTAGLILLQPGMVSNAPPAVGAIVANDPVAVGTPVTVSANYSDADAADTHTGAWSWGDNTATTVAALALVNGTQTASASHTYTAAGVYPVSLELTDSTGRKTTVSRDVVVYDPSAGFVTGGGWINSPPGAYKQDQALAGRATFGFVSKYQKGANKPSGTTEFQFQAARLNFHSDNYEWLVVAGARAQYKGTGTINGQGSFKFLLTAVDGDKLGKGTPDRFRIKIWHLDPDTQAEVVDYDNQIDQSAVGGNSEGTAIGGGSVVIHAK